MIVVSVEWKDLGKNKGNSNADMEYQLRRLESIKARDRTQIIGKLELTKKKIFQ